MIVCLCANVSERELAETISAGASTVKEVGRRCGAGTGCGACKPLIRECLARCRAAAIEQVTVTEVTVTEVSVTVVSATVATEPASA